MLLLVATLALLGAGCGSGGKLGAKALSEQAKTLRSEASEGALLAEDAGSGRSTRIFTREHASDLSKAAAKVETSLKTAETAPALAPTLRRLSALAARVRGDLGRLGGASKDEQRALAPELEAAARQSQKLGEGLK